MNIQQAIVFGLLFLVFVLFVWGRWRYDVVALIALLAVTITGIIPPGEAFNGFGHPAVITVAAVLVVSRGLQNSGVIERISGLVDRVGPQPIRHVAILTLLVAVLSAFMNNVGALAIFIPIALRLARENKYSPGLLLMPMAFASLLGGMTTLIGTPPNIIIANFRAETGAEPYGMFAFSPVGVGVALVGLLFIILLGWRLVPQRNTKGDQELFRIEDYITELELSNDSPLVGVRIRDLPHLTKANLQVVGLLRNGKHRAAPSSYEYLNASDVLVVEVDTENLKKLVDKGLTLAGSKFIDVQELESDEIEIAEVIVKPGSVVQFQTAKSLNLRARYGVNLLAISRQGHRLRQELGEVKLRAGDILLLQGRKGILVESITTLGLLPLADRDLKLDGARSPYLAVGIFAVSILLTVLNLLPVQVSFATAAVAMILLKVITLKEAYQSVDWPILILLGGMIPVGQALEISGGADLIANLILRMSENTSPVLTLAMVLVGTMFLSDLVNNAAAALLMAPIAFHIAGGLGVSSDPFLMAVAIGASCAFLTPIGHQSNTLVLGPGGYQFKDYWRMGLPLEILIVVVSMPLLLLFWPL